MFHDILQGFPEVAHYPGKKKALFNAQERERQVDEEQWYMFYFSIKAFSMIIITNKVLFENSRFFFNEGNADFWYTLYY